MVELDVEGRKKDEVLHYVGQVKELEEDGHLLINFLRSNSEYSKDTFHFPAIEDESKVVRSRVLGVLTRIKGSTQRLANLVKISPPLLNFNMR